MQKYYRFLHGDESVRKNSSSGGAFTAISDYVLDMGGVVYGCITDESLNVKHIRVTSREERDKMRGSKYVQSDIRKVFLQIKKDLVCGKFVLLTGTPCQNFAVLKYLSSSKICTDRLVTLELICHGVGSKLFLADYIHNLEVKYGGKAKSVNFRAKHRKGQKQDMEVLFDNKKRYNSPTTRYDWFYSVYLKNLILRPSCYECPFATKERFSDLTIADHWGYRDEEAYSLIVSNTPTGDNIIKTIILNQKNEAKEISECEVRQPHMIHPCDRPDKRDEFWNIYHNYGYSDVQKWIGNNTFCGKMKSRLARVAYDIHIAQLIKHLCKIMRKKI